MANDNSDGLLQGFYLNHWLIDPAHGRFETKGHRIHIEPKVMDVLLCLARHHGQVVSRAELLDEVWRDLVVSEEVLTRCVSELRTALNDTHRERKFIRTVPKRGYCLIVEPVPVGPTADQPLTAATDTVHNEGNPALEQPHNGGEQQPKPDTYDHHTPTSRRIFNRWIGQESLIAIALLAVFLLYKWGTDSFQSSSPPEQQSFVSQSTEPDNEFIAGSERLDVVVLPFVNITASDDYFSIGLAEDIRNKLIRTKGLRVAARTSSEVFLGRAIDIREIGTALNARTVVEGTVRMDEARIRLTVQLSDADNGHPIWAETYARDRVDIFSLQEEIATDVVKQLAPALSENSPQAADDITNNVQAYDNYLLGRFHWNKRTPKAIERAKSYFQRAIDLDPNYAAAYAGLADSELVLPKYNAAHAGGAMPADTSQSVAALINTALTLNPSDSEANASRGLLAQLQNDQETAEAYYQRSLELNPNNSMALMWYGNLKTAQGLPLQAIEKFKAALNLDPLHPSIQTNYLGALLMLGENQELLSVAPYFYRVTKQQSVLKMQISALLGQGQFSQAIDLANQHSFSAPVNEYVHLEAAMGLIALQQFDDAREVIQALKPSPKALANAYDLYATLALATLDFEALHEVFKLAQTMFEDTPETCDHAYYWRYQGINSWLSEAKSDAEQAFLKSLNTYQTHCKDALPKSAETLSYLVLTAAAREDSSLAHEYYQQGLSKVAEAKQRGISHYSIWLAEIKLHLAMNEQAKAGVALVQAQAQGSNLYGWLQLDPVFESELAALLASPSGAQLQPLLQKYRQQQKQGVGLDLAHLKSS